MAVTFYDDSNAACRYSKCKPIRTAEECECTMLMALFIFMIVVSPMIVPLIITGVDIVDTRRQILVPSRTILGRERLVLRPAV